MSQSPTQFMKPEYDYFQERLEHLKTKTLNSLVEVAGRRLSGLSVGIITDMSAFIDVDVTGGCTPNVRFQVLLNGENTWFSCYRYHLRSALLRKDWQAAVRSAGLYILKSKKNDIVMEDGTDPSYTCSDVNEDTPAAPDQE